MAELHVLMIGDVVGEPGLYALETILPSLKERYSADFVVVNGENAADGFGIVADNLQRILAAGVDFVSSGNHVWEKRDFWPVLQEHPCIARPANYAPGAPGKGLLKTLKNGKQWVLLNLQGREDMSPIDCPFRCADEVLSENSLGKDTIILVDFHAESGREKEALGLYLDGRVSAVVGTHTHVQTADARVLPNGTVYISDLGMTGPAEGVIGMDAAICVQRCQNNVLTRMQCAQGDVVVEGVHIALDADSGNALQVESFRERIKSVEEKTENPIST